MLKLTIKKGSGLIEMPPICAGMSGSITEGMDDSGSTVIFTCKKNDSGAIIHRTVDSLNIEQGMYRAIMAADLQVLADLNWGESFELDIKKDYGTITLVFEHVQDSNEVIH